MIVDTSALAAILFDEPERPRFTAMLATTDALSISAGNWLELTVVLARLGRQDLLGPVEQLRTHLGIAVAAVTETQGEIARKAYLTFGRGSGHPARLNFGDCFSYALAIERGEPLLFKGDDFRHTDVKRAA